MNDFDPRNTEQNHRFILKQMKRFHINRGSYYKWLALVFNHIIEQVQSETPMIYPPPWPSYYHQEIIDCCVYIIRGFII